MRMGEFKLGERGHVMRQLQLAAPDLLKSACENVMRLRPRYSPATLPVLYDWYLHNSEEVEMSDLRNVFIGLAFKHCFPKLFDADLVVKSDRTGKSKYADVQYGFNTTVAKILGVKDSNFANSLQAVRGWIDKNVYDFRDKINELYKKVEQSGIDFGVVGMSQQTLFDISL